MSSFSGYLPALVERREGWRYDQVRKEGIRGARVDCRVDLARCFAHDLIGVCRRDYLVMDQSADRAGAVQRPARCGAQRNRALSSPRDGHQYWWFGCWTSAGGGKAE